MQQWILKKFDFPHVNLYKKASTFSFILFSKLLAACWTIYHCTSVRWREQKLAEKSLCQLAENRCTKKNILILYKICYESLVLLMRCPSSSCTVYPQRLNNKDWVLTRSQIQSNVSLIDGLKTWNIDGCYIKEMDCLIDYTP